MLPPGQFTLLPKVKLMLLDPFSIRSENENKSPTLPPASEGSGVLVKLITVDPVSLTLKLLP